MSSDLVIEAESLGFSFRDRRIIDSISFRVERERFVTFLGPSGCGKTTLLNIVAGIHRQPEGRLSVNTNRISFVFQHDTLLSWRTALGNVLLPFELGGKVITEEVRARGRRILAELGLEGFEDFAPAELSGGMKKRVEIARALVTEPELLILDEPFSSLDIITREKLNILLRAIYKRTRCAVVMVTHSVEEACFLSDRIYVLSSVPAQIISVKELGKNGSVPPDQYILSAAERDAAAEVRRNAKVLWATLREEAEEESARMSGLEENGSLRSPRTKPMPGGVRGFLLRHYGRLLIPVELLALYLILAFVKTRFAVPDSILPHPWSILSRFATTLVRGTILPDLGTTVYESLAGFTIAFFLSLLLGYGIARSRLAARLLMPWLIASNTIPTIALAPFLVLWFSFGVTPRVITSVIVIFFPMLINIISAIGQAEKSMRELMAFFRPPRLRRFIHFEFPASLPMIASGVKISITLSVIGSVVGEFVSGSMGLGSRVNIAKANFDPELMFVCLLWLMILGLSYYAAADCAHRLLARRIR